MLLALFSVTSIFNSLEEEKLAAAHHCQVVEALRRVHRGSKWYFPLIFFSLDASKPTKFDNDNDEPKDLLEKAQQWFEFCYFFFKWWCYFLGGERESIDKISSLLSLSRYRELSFSIYHLYYRSQQQSLAYIGRSGPAGKDSRKNTNAGNSEMRDRSISIYNRQG